MIESKELTEFPIKEKLLSMRRLFIIKEFLSRGPLPITMPLKHKSNISPKKSKKLLLNTNQLKELGKEFNISQLKPRSSIILNAICMLQGKEEDIFNLAMYKEGQELAKELPMDLDLELEAIPQLRLLMDQQRHTRLEGTTQLEEPTQEDIALEVTAQEDILLHKAIHTLLEEWVLRDTAMITMEKTVLEETATECKKLLM